MTRPAPHCSHSCDELGRTPGKFREHMTLNVVETNKKSIEQLEAVLSKLKGGGGLLAGVFSFGS